MKNYKFYIQKGGIAYCASKGAIEQITKAAALGKKKYFIL